MKEKLKIGSLWEVEHWRRSSFRAGAWSADVTVDHNLVTNEGLDALLDIMFHGTSQIGTWYIALFNDDHTVAAGDTYATPGYTESSNYDEANRPAFTEATAASQSMTNSANKATFTMSTSETIYGAALVSDNTKGDTAATATLFGAAQFAASKAVEDDDTLKITVTITVSSS